MSNATEYVKQQVSVEMLMTYYGFRHMRQTGNTIRACCEIHKGSNPTAFVVNTDNNLWYCHTGSCSGGDIFNLVMKMEHIEVFEDAVRRIAELFHIDIANMEIQIRANQILIDTKKWLDMMRKLTKDNTAKPFDMSSLGALHKIKSYRSFTHDILEHFGIMYCANNQRIVIPIYQDDILVGVTMRRTRPHPVKWLHQPSGILTGSYLYNKDNIDTSKPIVIVEGAWDTINAHRYGYTNTVATFGCHITDTQEHMLLRMGYDVIIAYDADKAGTIGTNNFIQRMKRKMDIRVANIPEGKDIGELTKCEMDDAIQGALNVHEYERRMR